MKKILVPTDFSDNANNALVYAVRIANQFGSSITLLHTFKIYSTTGMFVSVERYMEEEAAEEMLRVISKVEPQLENGGRIDSKIIRGEAIPLIVDIAGKSGYDMIIMGTQGASGLREVLVGSVTNGVIKNASTPVLAVPSHFEYQPIQSIVFAVDEEGISRPEVTAPLVEIAKKYSAKVRVFHKDTGERDPGIDPNIEVFLESVEHSFHYELNDSFIIDSIREFVEDYDANLLCMVRRTRGFLEEIFHVSVTSKGAFQATIPLLVLQDRVS